MSWSPNPMKEPAMNRYLLLLHETPSEAHMSASDMQAIIASHQAWAAELAAQGALLGAEKLTDDGGRHLRLRDGRPLATDGPYAEAHDVIGGFYLLQAETEAQAEAMAAGCPHLAGSQWVELRRVEALD